MLLDLESKALVTILWNGSKCFRAVGVWESWTSLHLFNTSFYFEWQREQCKYESSFYQLLELLQDLLSLFYCFFLFWILANRPWKVFCRVRLKKPKTPQTKNKRILPFQAVYIVRVKTRILDQSFETLLTAQLLRCAQESSSFRVSAVNIFWSSWLFKVPRWSVKIH